MERFNPHRRFMILLGGLLALSAVLSSALIFQLIERNVIKETQQITREAVAVHFRDLFPNLFSKQPSMTDGYYGAQVNVDNFETLKRTVAMHFDLYNIEQTRFIQPDGQIYFSYQPDEIGKTLPLSDSLQSASQAEFMAERADANHLNMWIPVTDEQGEVREVAYVTRNISTQMKAIRQMQMISAAAITLVFLVLYVSLRQVFIRSTKEIKKRNRDLNDLLHSLENTYDASLQALSAALDLRDNETEGHCLRVTAYTVHLAKKMGIDSEKLIHIARGALLHDIGKIGIPDHILRKPGSLDDEEWKVMKSHVTIGADMLEPIEFLQPALPIVRYHHERWDGKGYYQGLKGEEIPLEARIFALCDTYDAMTSDRPYRKGRSHEEAVKEIADCSGTQFDPEVVRQFLAIPKQEWLALKRLPENREEAFSLKHLLAS